MRVLEANKWVGVRRYVIVKRYNTEDSQMPMRDSPKISFGIIVLNGEPFIEYCVRGLYKHAHQIIIAEGAAKSASEFATDDGHSLDDTREILQRLKRDHDPENKIVLVETEGFWADRDAQSSAYAARATGDYLWQVDADEFYREDDIAKIIDLLSRDPSITGASFRWLNFFGGAKVTVDGWFLKKGGGDVNRLMKWGPGFTYGKHWEGPRSYDKDGSDMTQLNWLSADATESLGVRLFHYSLVFPFQVLSKSKIYKDGTDPTFFHSASDDWAEDVWLNLQRPFDVHNRYGQPAWLEEFSGNDPEIAREMFAELDRKYPNLPKRSHRDLDALLSSRSYKAKRFIAKRLFWGRKLLGESVRGYWYERAVFVFLNDGFSKLLSKVRQRISQKVFRRQDVS